ncbi:unnamed protein product [Schistocephalus solidus]|uniref:ELYS domain-containing protein n=1 Tax=Schistocephalus solidus TaxID=70667 RepID=A0A183SLB7_SCHSO|nr:unnamed protein product [Schistocephalus solidus]
MGMELWNVGEDAGGPFHSRTLTPIPTCTIAAYRIGTLRSMSASPRFDPAITHSVALPTATKDYDLRLSQAINAAVNQKLKYCLIADDFNLPEVHWFPLSGPVKFENLLDAIDTGMWEQEVDFSTRGSHIPDLIFCRDQYDIYRQDHTSKRGGGCLLYIDASFKHFPVDLDVTSFSVVVVYFDLSKALHKVPHRRLLVKLEALGFRPSLLDFIGFYLSNHSQKVLETFDPALLLVLIMTAVNKVNFIGSINLHKLSEFIEENFSSMECFNYIHDELNPESTPENPYFQDFDPEHMTELYEQLRFLQQDMGVEDAYDDLKRLFINEKILFTYDMRSKDPLINTLFDAFAKYTFTAADFFEFSLKWDRNMGVLTLGSAYLTSIPQARRNQLFTLALLQDRHKFIQSLVDIGIQPHEFVTAQLLRDLYNNCSGSANLLRVLYQAWLVKPGRSTNVQRAEVHFDSFEMSQKGIIAGEKRSTVQISLEDIHAYLFSALGGFSCPEYLQNTEHLFIWSVLMNSHEMAIELLKVGPNPVASALIGAALNRHYASLLPTYDTFTRQQLEERAAYFEQVTSEVLMEVDSVDRVNFVWEHNSNNAGSGPMLVQHIYHAACVGEKENCPSDGINCPLWNPLTQIMHALYLLFAVVLLLNLLIAVSRVNTDAEFQLIFSVSIQPRFCPLH